MTEGEMEMLVERLALDTAVWRRLKVRVERRQRELYPPAPVHHGERGSSAAGHGGGCMCAECFGAAPVAAVAPGHRLRDEEGRL